jgi:hypothetical protein
MVSNGGSLYKRNAELFGRPKDQWSTIDNMIYSWSDYFKQRKDVVEKNRFKAIRESLDYHYKSSRFYNRLCKEYDFKPGYVKNIKDFVKIPMLPDTFFKEYPAEKPREIFRWLSKISTVDLGDYDYNGKSLQGFLRWAETRLKGMVNHSSGTSGHFSFMFRDRVTYQRFYYSIVKTLLDVVPGSVNDPHYVYPGSPNTYLTLGRWLGEGGRIFSEHKRHFLTDREINMDIARLMSTGDARGFKDKLILLALKKAMLKGEDKMIGLLEEINKKGEQAVIIGPPFQIYSIMLKMKKLGVSLSMSNSVLFTGGGWKIFEHRKISEEEFAKLVEETLGIPPECYVDIYGMSEMNGIAISCGSRYKHLHPWIHPMVMDENEGLLGFDEWGRFAFLDPIANSYPGYIITGDRVKIYEKCPGCGRPGPVIDSDISRMTGAEAKGCADLMRGLMAEEFKKVETSVA